MTQDDSSNTPGPQPRRRARRSAPIAIAVGAAVVAVLAGAYAARNVIAREALLGWLRDRGVPAQADVSGLGLGGLSGRIVVGPAERPDFAVEASEIGYHLTGPWSGEAFGVEILSVRLVRPVLKARLKDGKLSLGALDPVIAELRRRPPRPDARQPLIRVEGGRVAIDGDYGRAEVRADALLNDGKLLRLDARLASAALASGPLAAELGPTRLLLTTRGDRVDLDLDARVESLVSEGLALSDAHLRLTGQGPYPDLKKRRGDGALVLRLAGEAEGAETGTSSLHDATFSGEVAGRVAGWIDTLVFTGAGTAEVAAGEAYSPTGEAGGLALELSARTLNWMRAGGDRVLGDVRGTAQARTLTQGPLRLQAALAGFDGPVGFGAGGTRLDLKGGVSARGAVAGLGAPVRGDVAEVAAVKRLLQGFTFAAPRASLALDAGGLALDLAAPARLRGAGGGEAVLTTASGRPLLRKGRGAFDVTAAGGGLPRIKAAVDGWRPVPGGVIMPLRLAVRSDFEPAREGAFETVGELHVADGTTRFRASRCGPVTVARLELGENDVTGLKGELCPGAQPLFEHRGAAWRVRGRARRVAAQIGILQADLADGAGTVEFGQSRGALSATLELQSGRLEDAAPQRRFHPLQASGPAILRDGIWQAAMVLADPAGRRIGEAQVSHDTRTGVGGAELDTGDLAFAPGALQPAALSPLAAALGPPVTGHAGFQGDITWSREGVESGGLLTIPQLDFTSPLGAIHGLSGEVAFTSLVPLVAPPGQRLRAAAIDAFAPLAEAQTTFGIGDQALQVRGLEAAVGGGRVRIAALDVPFAPGVEWGGVLELEGVQLADVVEASPLGASMDLTARVSGRIPFQWAAGRLRVSKGELHALEAGRLSIRRETLSGVKADAADAADAAAAPNAFTDFAYQAMENLAFESLSATVDSLPEGRLGMLFHIKGEHQPPKKQVLRVSVRELMNRSFLDRPQPLPSGVKVDLTLDASFNLDQILDDLAGYRRLRDSADVQAQGAMKTPAAAERTK